MRDDVDPDQPEHQRSSRCELLETCADRVEGSVAMRDGEEHGFWPAGRTVTTTPKRYRPGASDVMALRVGHEKLTAETGWMPTVSWEEGVLQTIRWYAENRERWIGRVDWLPTGSPVTSR